MTITFQMDGTEEVYSQVTSVHISEEVQDIGDVLDIVEEAVSEAGIEVPEGFRIGLEDEDNG